MVPLSVKLLLVKSPISDHLLKPDIKGGCLQEVPRLYICMCQPLHLVWQKYVRKSMKMSEIRQKTCMADLKMRINCKQKCDRSLRNAGCSISKVEIISLGFKWLIVLRSAIKTRDQTHLVLKNVLVVS